MCLSETLYVQEWFCRDSVAHSQGLMSCLVFPPQVKKVVKTTTTRTVVPSVSDTISLDGGGSVTGMGGYTAPMDRVYRQAPGAGAPMDYPTHTVPRNYHYGPPGGYDDYRAGPPSETYPSLSRGARMDDRYRYNMALCVFKYKNNELCMVC